MQSPVTIEGVYQAVDELIVTLKRGGRTKLAAVLDHRVHKVAWTSGVELLEELRHVLSNALQTDSPSARTLPTRSIQDLLRAIDALAGAPEAPTGGGGRAS